MKLIAAFVFLSAFAFVAFANKADEFSCTGKKDGYYEIACKSFIHCRNGYKTIHYCKGDKVLDRKKMKCVNIKKAPLPCGEIIDCSNKKDGHYPDIDYKCKSFYTCESGKFLGHYFCPDGLVFNKPINACDWPYNVPPPCGTKTF